MSFPCNPTANPPLPRGLSVIPKAWVTPAMVAWATSVSNDGAVPIGSTGNRGWWPRRGDQQLIPLVAWVSCHDRHANESAPSGAYHGVTLTVAEDPRWYPQETPPAGPYPEPGSQQPATLAERGPDWPYVVGAGAALVTVGGLFIAAVRAAGKAIRRGR